MTILSTNTVKAKDPNASYARFLKEVTDERGRTVVKSTIPLRHVRTQTLEGERGPDVSRGPRQSFGPLDPAFLGKALNKGRRPEKGFPVLQTNQLRDIEDNKKRLAVMAEKKAAEAKAKIAAPAKAKRTAKKGK